MDQQPLAIKPYQLVQLDRDDFPLSESFEIELYTGGGRAEKQMRYRAKDLDIVIEFAWWDDVEPLFRKWTLHDIPRGSFADPYFDTDQGWEILVCQNDGEVFVGQGDGEGIYHARFRIPAEQYLQAWHSTLEKVRAAS